MNHQRYLTGRAHGELAEAKRVYKEKTAAFKKSFLEKNSLEIVPDEEDDCYEAYRAQLKENCKKEHFKLRGWKTQESAVLSSFEIKKEKLDEEDRMGVVWNPHTSVSGGVAVTSVRDATATRPR